MSRIKFLFFAILFGVPVFFLHFFAIFLTAPALHLICVYVLLTIFVPYSVGLFSSTLLCIFFRFAHNFNYLPVEKGKSCSVELLVFIVEGLTNSLA